MCYVLGVVFTVFVGHTMTMFLGWLSMFGGCTMVVLVCLPDVVVVYTMVVCMVPVLRRLGNV